MLLLQTTSHQKDKWMLLIVLFKMMSIRMKLTATKLTQTCRMILTRTKLTATKLTQTCRMISTRTKLTATKLIQTCRMI